MNGKTNKCPVELTLDVIDGKWKVLILWHLRKKGKRYSTLKNAITGINQKMLTQQLRELEADGIIERMVYAEVPPKVEYSLTEFGNSLMPVLNSMFEWGANYAETRLDNLKEACP